MFPTLTRDSWITLSHQWEKGGVWCVVTASVGGVDIASIRTGDPGVGKWIVSEDIRADRFWAEYLA